MANATLFIDGLGHVQADAGIPISSLPVISGAKGIVTDFSIIWGGRDLPPNDGAVTIQGFPYWGAGAFAVGTDSNGAIGVAKNFTLAPGNEDGTLWASSGSNVSLPDGFWASDYRIFINDITGTRQIQIDILVLELTDLVETLTTTPDELIASDPSWDPVEEEGSVDLDWTYDNTLAEDPDGFAILRDGAIIGTVPFVTGESDYEYTDHFDEEGTFVYTIVAFKADSPNYVMSPPSSPPVDVIVEGGSSPDISVTSDMALALDWNSIMAFITDPSGIYGLIPNKTHDTIYNRDAEQTSINVKIPDPFVRLAFLPDE